MAKLKPILFNTAMVQKIMAGEKTETRRVVLPQPEGARFVLDCDEENRTFDLMCGNNGAGGIFRDWAETVKPKFWFGDVLYIREAWRVQSAHRFEADAKIEFRAGGPLGKIQFPGGCSDSESREAKEVLEQMQADDAERRKQYAQTLPKAIAIDFDGCLCANAYPDIGAPNWEIIVAAAAEQIAGAGLILWTCREGELLENALEACARWGLHFDAVNDSLPSWKKFYGDDTRKVGATEYWDDKAYRVQNGKLMKEAAHEMV